MKFAPEEIPTAKPSFLENMKRHSVFDAAGHINVLGLGVDDPFLSSKPETNAEQRGIADHMPQLIETSCGVRFGDGILPLG